MKKKKELDCNMSVLFEFSIINQTSPFKFIKSALEQRKFHTGSSTNMHYHHPTDSFNFYFQNATATKSKLYYMHAKLSHVPLLR